MGRRSTTRGFARTGSLLEGRIRKASESRGFAQARLLTHWAEIAGPRLAALSRPVEISYGRGGLGACLTLLTTGANAPLLEMEKERLRERVNAVYGYNAIARIRITQTAATGFADGQADFAHRPRAPAAPPDDPAARAAAAETAEGISDGSLRAALERLARNHYATRPRRS
ncbi:hypothetical protein ROJ8625_03064 [Roseivivax jejudonensis]|uniref:Zn-ribbon-containing, possibly RNA-binding protein and truncated derivatives n=1 Tax=Roseivivax jejudonensis TaxID=1529041 RepID=A0A1X6ZUU3_9RHOB|nr:DciA family protein [Roseivivax jejudonensis]SLN60394.1 hypothetical protein ROJ8625_03064 [Roseivivax jejudonensis]